MASQYVIIHTAAHIPSSHTCTTTTTAHAARQSEEIEKSHPVCSKVRSDGLASIGTEESSVLRSSGRYRSVYECRGLVDPIMACHRLSFSLPGDECARRLMSPLIYRLHLPKYNLEREKNSQSDKADCLIGPDSLVLSDHIWDRGGGGGGGGGGV